MAQPMPNDDDRARGLPGGESAQPEDTKLVSYGLLKITPATAGRWVEQFRYPPQRALRSSQVRKLIRAIQLGEFESTTVMFARLGDRLYLVDGQHRLHAIRDSGQTVVLNVLCKLVDSEEDLAHLYASLDCPVTRTFMDGYAAFGLQAELGFTQRAHVGMLSAAVVYIINGFRAGVGDDAGVRGVRLHLMREWAPEARDAFALLAGDPDARRNGSAGILSVMLVTLRYQPDRATDFWRRVIHGVELTQSMPEFALRRWLHDHPAGGPNRPPLYSRAVAAAWNAHYEGRMLTKVYPGDTSGPIVIKGTPYNGKYLAP